MTYNQLKYVISVAENGSFSRAAKELFIAQPSLSNQIKALEEELGTPLFIRMHHNLKLTEAGHDFVLYSKRIINEFDHLQNLMQSYSSYSRGNLVIGTFNNAGYMGITETIMTFQRLYPKINVRLVMDHSDRLIDLLMTQEIDIAVLDTNETVLKENDFQYVQLEEEPFVVILPKHHYLAGRTALQLKDIRNEKIILPPEGSHARSVISGALQSEGNQLLTCGQCSSTEGCVQMVSCGFGLSIVTASSAKSLKNDSFHIIPLLPPIRLKTYLAMLKTSYPGSISDEMFGFLQTQFR